MRDVTRCVAPTSLGLLLLAMAGCGGDPGPKDWIDARAAAVHCTSAGRNRMPPVLAGLPVPNPPSGLYARTIDAMALNDLGFQRDAVACAILHTPDPQQNEAVTTSLEALLRTRQSVSRSVVAEAGRCACEVAGRLGRRALLPVCDAEPTRNDCTPNAEVDAAVALVLEPLEDALTALEPPLLHWRLVGKTDRSGWFVERKFTLLDRHSGGSTIFERGEAVQLRDNGALIRALLEEEGVVAVSRQDSGRALLVVRELDGQLILDHFAYPAVGPRLVGVLSHLDNASIDSYRARLSKPDATRALAMDPRKGSTIEVDVRRLAEVDAFIEATSPLSGGRVVAAERPEDMWVDAVAIQAPYGKDGEELLVDFTLSSSGERWAMGRSADTLVGGIDGLGGDEDWQPRAAGSSPLVLRGSSFESTLVRAFERAPTLLETIESRYPTSVGGTQRAWEIAVPPTNLSPVVGADAPFSGLRDAFEAKPYEVTVTLDDNAPRVHVRAAPK